MSWRPVLIGDDAARALAAVQAIAADWREPPATLTGTLYGGLAGIALLHGYLAELEPGAGHEDRAVELLGEAVNRLEPIQVGIAWGVAGIAWVTDHLQRRGLAVEVDESLDAFLGEFVIEQPWDHPYDLMEGLAGMALAMVHRRDPAATAIVEQAIARLEEIAVRTPAGLAFAYLAPLERGALAAPVHVGPSHGITGVIAVLARCIEAGIAADRARALLDPLVAWLFTHQLPAGASSCFPSIVSEHAELARTGGPGWCHGDPGVAAAVLVAARRANVPAWEQIALATMRAAAARTSRYAAMPDLGLCHGATGVAHVLARCGEHAAARPLYLQAIERWDRERANDLPLLEGTVGIALALVSAATPIAPDWDEVFAMS
ncbi:MAG: lanthionine synthetase LanC family protein [Kofleriaceae bacterium]